MIDFDSKTLLICVGWQELLDFCKRWDISIKELAKALKDEDWWERQNNLPSLFIIELCYLPDKRYESVEEIAKTIAKMYFPFPDKIVTFRIFLTILLKTPALTIMKAERRER